MASPSFLFYISLYFFSHFSFTLSSLTILISPSILQHICLFSPSLLFHSSLSSPRFLIPFLPRAFSHYDSLAESSLLYEYTIVDLHPPYFCCLKIPPLSRLCISCSCHFLFNSSAPVPDLLPHFCFAFRVFLHLSFVFLPLVTFSVHPFPSAVSLSFVSPFSVSVCLRVL